jgi:hypothetical protein
MESSETNGNGNGLPAPRRSGFASDQYWTPERREAQRQWAKKAREEGRFGGRQPGAGRPRTKTVSEVVSERAQENGERIARRLLNMVDHKNPTVSLGAIDRIHTMEQAVQKNMREDERELMKLSGKSLDQVFAQTLSELGVDYDYDVPPDQIEEEVE